VGGIAATLVVRKVDDLRDAGLAGFSSIEPEGGAAVRERSARGAFAGLTEPGADARVAGARGDLGVEGVGAAVVDFVRVPPSSCDREEGRSLRRAVAPLLGDLEAGATRLERATPWSLAQCGRARAIVGIAATKASISQVVAGAGAPHAARVRGCAGGDLGSTRRALVVLAPGLELLAARRERQTRFWWGRFVAWLSGRVRCRCAGRDPQQGHEPTTEDDRAKEHDEERGASVGARKKKKRHLTVNEPRGALFEGCSFPTERVQCTAGGVPRLSRRATVVAAALLLLVGVPGAYVAVASQTFPPDTTPEGAYMRIVQANRRDRPEEMFAYLETEAQWSLISALDYRKKAAAKVRETYPEAEAKELLATLVPVADAADGPALFALEMRRRGWLARLRRDLSGVAKVEVNGERATVETVRGTRYPFRRRENGIWGLTQFTPELRAEAERAARDDEVVSRAAADYRAARPASSR
jgi:hypothetical protein